jgi:hypothetical protein
MIFDIMKIERFISPAIGSFKVLNNHRKDSVRTGVIEVLSGDNKRYFVKAHNRLSHWHPEVYAYKNWTKALKQQAPSLVAAFNDNGIFGVVLTTLQGKTVNEMQITDNEKLKRIYYDAGQLFRKMQGNIKGDFFGIPKADGTPFDDNVTTNPVTYISDSIESLFRSAYDKQMLESSCKPLIEWSIKNCNIMYDEVPVPTNWDLSQNNWMVDEDGNFTGFIDFENMLWGLSLDSFAVITERYTFNKPDLEKSFLDGYGLINDEITELKRKILSVNSSIASIVIGHQSNTQRLIDCGHRMLKHLIDVHKTGKTGAGQGDRPSVL